MKYFSKIYVRKRLTKKDYKYLRFYIFLDNKTKLDHTTIIIIIEDIYGKSILQKKMFLMYIYVHCTI